MTQLVLVLLGLAWVFVLAPDVARVFRPRRRGATSMDQFRRQLDSLGRSAPAAVRIPPQLGRREPAAGRPSRWSAPATAMPTTPKQAAVRRRDITTLLVLCVCATFAGSLATGSPWAICTFVLMLGCTIGYTVLAVRRRRAEPTAEIHRLPLRQADAGSTVTMIRRTASH